jgi:PAS domain S-box-containing protein
MLQTLFESALDAIVVFDDAGQLVDANPAACQLFGIAKSSLGSHVLSQFFALPQEATRGDVLVRTADGRTVSVEFRVKRDFIPGRHLAVLRDLGERHRAETELRANAEFLRRLVESSHDCIKVLDLDGRLLSMNEGGRRLLEMESVQPYMGRSWLDFWMGGHLERAAAAVEAARRGEVVRFDGFGPTARGTPKWWETVLAPINDSEGRPERLIAVSRDITDRVEAERAHRENLEQLRAVSEAANRAKDEFLATLAHELRNPLAAILNGVATLEAIGSPTPQANTVRSIIRRQTHFMAALLDDLLDVARIGEGKIVLDRVPLDVCQVVKAALDGERPRIERRRQSVAAHGLESPLVVLGDAVRLRQVAANLLNNASKYTPEGGRISVDLSREADEVVLRVSDSGIGIPADRLEDVFELFTQVATTQGRTEGGLGIGLTLVRRLAQLHGGSVRAESSGPGHGSRFTVRLPLTTAQVPRAPATGPATASRPQTVVLIEDQDDTRELLSESLQRAGHRVTAAPTGTEGLRLVRAELPTVVITDIGLPDMDGYAVAEVARRELGERCMLVAFSGYGQAHDRERAIAAGFDAHVLKPVDPSRLLEIIARGPRGPVGPADDQAVNAPSP